MDSRHYSTRALYRRLLLVARPVWPRLCGVFLLTLLSAPIALLTPIPLKMAVDSAIGTAPLPRWVDAVLPASIARSPTGIVWVAAILVLVIGLIGRLQQVVAATAQTATAERVTLALKTAIFRHAQRLSLAYHDTRGTADAAYRLMHDAPALQYIVVEGVVPFATATATLVAIVWVTLRLDWQLALVALGVSPILVLLSRTYRRRMRAQAREVKRLEAGALAIVQEVLGALRVVKAFGQEERETNRFGGQSLKGSAARIRARLRRARRAQVPSEARSRWSWPEPPAGADALSLAGMTSAPRSCESARRRPTSRTRATAIRPPKRAPSWICRARPPH